MPDVCGMSPEMTLNSVVFPAPFGPRMARARRRDVEVDVAHGIEAADRRPIPAAEDRAGVLGGAFLHGLLLADDLHRVVLPMPRQVFFRTSGMFGPERGVVAAEGAAERLVDARHVPTVLIASLPSFMYSCWS